MADEAVIDAPELEVEPVETAEVEQPEEVAEPEAPATETPEVKGDGRKLPAEIRALKETDPALYKQKKAEFFSDLAERETFGQEAAKVRAFLDERGGIEGITQAFTDLESKAQEFENLSQAIAEGRADDVLKMVPQESYAALGPAVAQKWAEADPEGWGRAMSGVFAATLAANKIPLFLERMELRLEAGKVEDVSALIQNLKTWAESFEKQATAPVTPKQPAAKGPDVNQERQQWEQEKFTNTLTQEVESIRSQAIEKSLETYFSRRPKDVDAKELAIGNVRQQVIQRLTQDADFQKSLNALVARRDKDGAMRLIKSREAKAIEEIAPKVGRTIFGQPAVAKPAVAAPAATRKPVPTVPVDPKQAILARIAAR